MTRKSSNNLILPLAPLERLMKESGATRVSEDAKIELALHLQQTAEKFASIASQVATHAKRKTIKERDIVLAKKSFDTKIKI